MHLLHFYPMALDRMLKYLFRAGIAAVSLSFASGARAAEPIEIVGLGASSCSQYLQEIDGNLSIEREYISWALGYMSGLLVRAPVGEIVQLRNPNLPLLKQAGFLRAYCAAHPDVSFSEAVQELYKTLRATSPKAL